MAVERAANDVAESVANAESVVNDVAESAVNDVAESASSVAESASSVAERVVNDVAESVANDAESATNDVAERTPRTPPPAVVIADVREVLAAIQRQRSHTQRAQRHVDARTTGRQG